MGCVSSKLLISYDVWRETLEDINYVDFGEHFKGPTILSRSNYSIGPVLGDGIMGIVHAGIDRRTKGFVALKFFGYFERPPRREDIEREICFMTAMGDIPGVVHIHGVFMDTTGGLIVGSDEDGKKSSEPYPVIVMDFLDGGEVNEYIRNTENITEHDIKDIFRSFVVALAGIHARGYIHNDLKVQNLMLESQHLEDLRHNESVVRIIDLGYVMRLPQGQTKVIGERLRGTPGYLAPETLTRHEYSYKTDMWQAGCILYVLLSGICPFSTEDYPDYDHSVSGKYYPMTGEAWQGISSSAKELAKCMLVLNADDRLTCEEVLQHPWLASANVGTEPLGTQYKGRMKHLVLKQRVKEVFLHGDIKARQETRSSIIREILMRALEQNKLLVEQVQIGEAEGDGNRFPMEGNCWEGIKVLSITKMLSTLSDDSRKMATVAAYRPIDFTPAGDADNSSGGTGSTVEHSQTDEYNCKMLAFKHKMVTTFCNEDDIHTTADGQICEIPTAAHKQQPKVVTYEEFVKLVAEAGLPELAKRDLFRMFDVTNSGTIDLAEFLLTMNSLQSVDLAAEKEMGYMTSVNLYFRMFDVYDTGMIEFKDFGLVLESLIQNDPLLSESITGYSLRPERNGEVRNDECKLPAKESMDGLISSHLPPAVVSRAKTLELSSTDMKLIEDIFVIMDIDGDGKVSVDDFRRFYREVILR